MHYVKIPIRWLSKENPEYDGNRHQILKYIQDNHLDSSFFSQDDLDHVEIIEE